MQKSLGALLGTPLRQFSLHRCQPPRTPHPPFFLFCLSMPEQKTDLGEGGFGEQDQIWVRAEDGESFLRLLHSYKPSLRSEINGSCGLTHPRSLRAPCPLFSLSLLFPKCGLWTGAGLCGVFHFISLFYDLQ